MAAHHYQGGMPSSLRYEPQSCNLGNPCGASGADYTESPSVWESWYEQAKVSPPFFPPGGDVELHIQITADHGGQSWLMISCADEITESGPWTYLERAEGDRGHHFMPSNPGIYAWGTDEAKKTMGDVLVATWTVPQEFSCPGGRGVGRWLWKTGNTCNDVNNRGRHTESFKLDEFAAVVHAYDSDMYIQESCGSAPETFITCFDFTLHASPTPVPTPTPTPSPTPVPSPVPPGPCHSISDLASDDWCNKNCAAGNCPSAICVCDHFSILA